MLKCFHQLFLSFLTLVFIFFLILFQFASIFRFIWVAFLYFSVHSFPASYPVHILAPFLFQFSRLSSFYPRSRIYINSYTFFCSSLPFNRFVLFFSIVFISDSLSPQFIIISFCIYSSLYTSVGFIFYFQPLADLFVLLFSFNYIWLFTSLFIINYLSFPSLLAFTIFSQNSLIFLSL